MSKGLESLERINKSVIVIGDNGESQQYAKDYSCIEKELKALEIINNKHVNIYWLKLADNLSEYNYFVADLPTNSTEDFTEEEFKLLKEVVK